MDKQPNKTEQRFVFSCAAGMLYIMPSVMCLLFGMMTEGFSYKFVIAFITAGMAFPPAIVGLNAYKKHKNRSLVYALIILQLIAHLIAGYFLTTWYIILLPAAILALMMCVTAKVI